MPLSTLRPARARPPPRARPNARRPHRRNEPKCGYEQEPVDGRADQVRAGPVERSGTPCPLKVGAVRGNRGTASGESLTAPDASHGLTHCPECCASAAPTDRRPAPTPCCVRAARGPFDECEQRAPDRAPDRDPPDAPRQARTGRPVVEQPEPLSDGRARPCRRRRPARPAPRARATTAGTTARRRRPAASGRSGPRPAAPHPADAVVGDDRVLGGDRAGCGQVTSSNPSPATIRPLTWRSTTWVPGW